MAQESMTVEEIARQGPMRGETRTERRQADHVDPRRADFETLLAAQPQVRGAAGTGAGGQEPDAGQIGDQEPELEEYLGGALMAVQERALHILVQAASMVDKPGVVRMRVTAEEPSGETAPGRIRRPVSRDDGRVPVHDIITQARHKMMLQLAENLALQQEAAGLRQPALGRLSAMFESGEEGVAAVGYDHRGGTSYGKYQISSRMGSMAQFLSYLDDHAPDLAQRLREAGPANTGSRRGEMPREWREIARDDPERFENLQDDFIFNTFYVPALESIAEQTSINIEDHSPVLMEVLWSTSVQHGITGASNIFRRAAQVAGQPEDTGFDKNLIEEIYRVRRGGFDSASRSVRLAVKARLNREEVMALSMLQSGRNQMI